MSDSHSPLMRRRSSRMMMSSQQSIDGNEDGKAHDNSSDSIKVVCRFRPIRVNAKQQSATDANPFVLNEETAEVDYASYYTDKKCFKFDRVFGENTTQVQVFDEVKGVVGSVMSGFNGTIMAYGQTSAGKSFTMEGLSLWEGEGQGLIPRCVNSLFEEIGKSDPNLQFQVVVSFFEVYCEKIRDLLNPQSINLKLRESKDSGFVVQDVTEIFCTDRDSVMRVIEFGKTNRASAPTLMNAESSRSHSIVTILVDQKDSVSGRQRRGTLFLVDLAGSEKVSKTGASGMRLEEAKNINSSLTTLGMVINSLCDGAGHVPYRDSKLTMILMEALGGNSKTTLIICCTRESSQQSETLSTLRFGERAKKIQNHAKVNEELSVTELKALLAAAQKEITLLKKKLGSGKLKPGEVQTLTNDADLDDLLSLGGGESKESETITDLKQQIDEKLHRLGELEKEVDALKARIRVMEDELETERVNVQKETEEKMMMTAENTALRATITELEDKLVKQTLEYRKATKSVDVAVEKEKEKELVYDEATLLKELAGVSDLQSAVDDPNHNHSHNATSKRKPSVSGADQMSAEDSVAKSAKRAAMLEKAGAIEAALSAESGKPLPPLPTSASKQNHPQPQQQIDISQMRSDELTLQQLQEHSLILNAQLEAEVYTLNMSVNQQAQETKNAMEAAQRYADKYVKLREDYEVHIERLMLKLTQEQQARTILEDQLENAMRKVFLFSKEIEKQRGGFFGWFATSSRKSVDFSVVGGNGSGGVGSRGKTSEREMNLARTLELSNLRIEQLLAENDQLRESHGIVVETKESVINSLSKRTSEITNERDLYKSRMEELTATVEQLTNLLRSNQVSHQQQQNNLRMNSPSNNAHNMSIHNLNSKIQGGGANGSLGNTRPSFINAASLQMHQQQHQQLPYPVGASGKGSDVVGVSELPVPPTSGASQESGKSIKSHIGNGSNSPVAEGGGSVAQRMAQVMAAQPSSSISSNGTVIGSSAPRKPERPERQTLSLAALAKRNSRAPSPSNETPSDNNQLGSAVPTSSFASRFNTALEN